MENKIIKYVINLILAIVLFISEMILMIQFNISRGITQKDINRIIDKINIENEIIELDEYKELEEKINSELLQEIIENKEIEQYKKENLKSIYTNILYNENNPYKSSSELKETINNIILEQQIEYGITDEDIELVTSEIDKITKEIENQIEEIEIYKDNVKLVSTIISKKMTNYIIGFIGILIALIILINKSKEEYLFIGLPTIMVGIIFLVIALTLGRNINATGINEEIIDLVNTYLPNLIKILKKSSTIITILGAAGCTLYTVLNYQEVSEKNGNN